MVGGRVIEVCEVKGRPEVLWVNVADWHGRRNDTCAVFVENNETSQKIGIGDSLWWQAGVCRWTPQVNLGKTAEEHRAIGNRCGVDYEIKIPKVGYSGVENPAFAK